MAMEPIPNTKSQLRHTSNSSPVKGVRLRRVGLYKCKKHGVFKSPEYRPRCPVCGKGWCVKVQRGVAVE